MQYGIRSEFFKQKKIVNERRGKFFAVNYLSGIFVFERPSIEFYKCWYLKGEKNVGKKNFLKVKSAGNMKILRNCTEKKRKILKIIVSDRKLWNWQFKYVLNTALRFKRG